ncbi:MAG TPA: precorrin-2 C(20)-methyltransferase [Pseudonocardiaceae bacterium]|nr:precorrin-2 C(20)-methyltransferase [Pseudonocardiaceae bacterium]
MSGVPRLVGVGVGPGDPELLTLAGLRELRTAGRVFVPVLAADDEGRAEAVVRAHLPADAPIERLVFALSDPVDGPQGRRRRHWDEAADIVARHLREHGDTAAFATLGDPAVYSTFGYLADTVRGLLPGVRVDTVPGITAMQAAASAARIALVEGAEPLTLLPVTREVTAVRAALDRGGTVVAYKGGRRLRDLRDVIARAGALDRAVYAEHLGTADVRVLPLSEVDVDVAPGAPAGAPYLSTVVVLPPRGERGEQL